MKTGVAYAVAAVVATTLALSAARRLDSLPPGLTAEYSSPSPIAGAGRAPFTRIESPPEDGCDPRPHFTANTQTEPPSGTSGNGRGQRVELVLHAARVDAPARQHGDVLLAVERERWTAADDPGAERKSHSKLPVVASNA